jgi:hypothetical protein
VQSTSSAQPGRFLTFSVLAKLLEVIVMPSNLLNCLICPKRPDFSDASHLLTHVSSKGHLSHLHKLQVRSHQEIAAGHQLALYNQWYQEHDMGHLLSERMLQKDGKVVAKREAKVKKEPDASVGPVYYSSNNVFENPVFVPREIRPAKHVLKQEPTDDESEYTSSPVKRNRYGLSSQETNTCSLTNVHRCRKRHATRNTQRSSNTQARSTADLVDEEFSFAAVVDVTTPVTPEASKLKGVIWPGMDLFDAASFEAKRKRNQKKDGSVLKQMEITSELIEPYEIIYSSGGTKIKERFIDGNVDSSSPLRGETPVPKPQVPKKRQPLAPASANTSRNARSKTKGKNSKTGTMAEVRIKTKPAKLSRTVAPSSSVEDFLESTPRFSVTAEENLEFRLAMGTASERKPVPNFTVYREEVTHSNHLPRLGAQNPFNAVPNQIYQARPQLSFVTAPWLQPQNQYPQHMHYGNPYMAYTGDGRAYPDFQQQRPILVKQESPTGFAFKQTFTPTRPNWPQPGMPNQNSFPTSVHTNYNNFFAGFSGQEDPFGYAKNPLSAAFDQNATQVNDMMASTGTRTPSPIKKKPTGLTLDGTLSDAEGEENYEQALFATSE